MRRQDPLPAKTRRRLLDLTQAFLDRRTGVVETARAVRRVVDLADDSDLGPSFATLYEIGAQTDHLPLTEEQRTLWSPEMRTAHATDVAYWEAESRRDTVEAACRRIMDVLNNPETSAHVAAELDDAWDTTEKGDLQVAIADISELLRCDVDASLIAERIEGGLHYLRGRRAARIIAERLVAKQRSMSLRP